MIPSSPLNQDLQRFPSNTGQAGYKFPLWIFLLLGLLTGVTLVVIHMSGILGEWRKLNPPPSPPAAFVGVSIYFYQADPYILGEDGNTYFCDMQQMSCDWEIEQASSEIILKTCQQNGLKFWGCKKPFKVVLDCVEAVMAGEFAGGPEIALVIDGDRQLWYWLQENKKNAIFYLPIAIFLGLLAGFVAAIVWSPILALFRAAQPGYLDALRDWEIRMLRWGGRAGSIPSLVYFSALLFVNQSFLPPGNLKETLLVFTLLGGICGLIMGWRWEVAGGVLVMLGFIAGLERYFSGIGSSAWAINWYEILLYWIPYLPGLFYLLAGVLSHQRRKTKSQAERPLH